MDVRGYTKNGNGQETQEKIGVGSQGSSWAVVLKKKIC